MHPRNGIFIHREVICICVPNPISRHHLPLPLPSSKSNISYAENLSHPSTASDPHIHNVHPPPLPLLQSSLHLLHPLDLLAGLLLLRCPEGFFVEPAISPVVRQQTDAILPIPPSAREGAEAATEHIREATATPIRRAWPAVAARVEVGRRTGEIHIVKLAPGTHRRRTVPVPVNAIADAHLPPPLPPYTPPQIKDLALQRPDLRFQLPSFFVLELVHLLIAASTPGTRVLPSRALALVPQPQILVLERREPSAHLLALALRGVASAVTFLLQVLERRKLLLQLFGLLARFCGFGSVLFGFPRQGADLRLDARALAAVFDGLLARAVEVLVRVEEFALSGPGGAFGAVELDFQGGYLLRVGGGRGAGFGELGAEIGYFKFHAFDGGGFAVELGL